MQDLTMKAPIAVVPDAERQIHDASKKLGVLTILTTSLYNATAAATSASLPESCALFNQVLRLLARERHLLYETHLPHSTECGEQSAPTTLHATCPVSSLFHQVRFVALDNAENFPRICLPHARLPPLERDAACILLLEVSADSQVRTTKSNIASQSHTASSPLINKETLFTLSQVEKANLAQFFRNAAYTLPVLVIIHRSHRTDMRTARMQLNEKFASTNSSTPAKFSRLKAKLKVRKEWTCGKLRRRLKREVVAFSVEQATMFERTKCEICHAQLPRPTTQVKFKNVWQIQVVNTVNEVEIHKILKKGISWLRRTAVRVNQHECLSDKKASEISLSLQIDKSQVVTDDSNTSMQTAAYKAEIIPFLPPIGETGNADDHSPPSSALHTVPPTLKTSTKHATKIGLSFTTVDRTVSTESTNKRQQLLLLRKYQQRLGELRLLLARVGTSWDFERLFVDSVSGHLQTEKVERFVRNVQSLSRCALARAEKITPYWPPFDPTADADVNLCTRRRRVNRLLREIEQAIRRIFHTNNLINQTLDEVEGDEHVGIPAGLSGALGNENTGPRRARPIEGHRTFPRQVFTRTHGDTAPVYALPPLPPPHALITAMGPLMMPVSASEVTASRYLIQQQSERLVRDDYVNTHSASSPRISALDNENSLSSCLSSRPSLPVLQSATPPVTRTRAFPHRSTNNEVTLSPENFTLQQQSAISGAEARIFPPILQPEVEHHTTDNSSSRTYSLDSDSFPNNQHNASAINDTAGDEYDGYDIVGETEPAIDDEDNADDADEPFDNETALAMELGLLNLIRNINRIMTDRPELRAAVIAMAEEADDPADLSSSSHQTGVNLNVIVPPTASAAHQTFSLINDVTVSQVIQAAQPIFRQVATSVAIEPALTSQLSVNNVVSDASISSVTGPIILTRQQPTLDLRSAAAPLHNGRTQNVETVDLFLLDHTTYSQ